MVTLAFMFSAILAAMPRRGWRFSGAVGGGAEGARGRHGVGAWGRGGAVAFEDVFPAFVDGGAVVQILLVELVFEPAIDTQIRIGFQGHGAGRPSYS
jgi:hypothetical protein